MRSSVLVLALAAASVVHAQSAPPQPDAPPASIAGVVANSITGSPLLRAHVVLRATIGGERKKFGALTDGGGKFSIRQLPPGEYTLTAERTGFVMPADMAGPRPVSLSLLPGARKEDLKLALIPTGAIIGRVLDQDGDPIPAASVTAESADGSGASARTDDIGRYRIDELRPGKYRIKVTSLNLPFPPETRTDGTKDFQYRSTYYSDSSTAKAATRIEVKPGVEQSGIDVRLPRQPIVIVSGTVTGLPPGAQNVSVLYRRIEGNVRLAPMNNVRPKADGSFEIWRLDAGKYGLTAAMSPPGGLRMQSATVEVEVAQTDIDRVALTVVPPSDVSGQMRFEDQQARPQQAGPPAPQGTATPKPQQPRLSLLELGGFASTSRVDIGADDSFMLTKLQPGRYRVSLSWQGAYIKSMRLGATEIDGEILDVRNGAGAGPLTVVVSSDCGAVSGTVRDGKGPAAGMSVALAPDGPGRSYSRIVMAAADGTYTVPDIPPGKYKLLAADYDIVATVRQGRSLDDYEDILESIEIHPGDKIAKDLKPPK